MLHYLKKIPIFSALSDKDLSFLEKEVKTIILQKGEVLFKEGDIADKAFLIKEGELEIRKKIENRDEVVAVRKSGDIIGEIALLEDIPRSATVIALVPTELIVVSKKSFSRLLQNNPSLTEQMLKTVLKRWQEIEAILRQSEKMAQLGILTAGIAHELNNPSASVQRGAASLQETLFKYQLVLRKIYELNLTPEQKNTLQTYEEKIFKMCRSPVPLSSLERADKEEELSSYLADLNISKAELIASNLIIINVTKKDIQPMVKEFKQDQLCLVLESLSTTAELYSFLNQVQTGAKQISQIAKALKSYIYLDQGPVQEVDIHKGLEESLVILSYKLKKGTNVIKDYDPHIPKIIAGGSELNQVWTNLIDNAIDAMGETGGTLTIKTLHDPRWIKVMIQDTGKGIPKEIQSKVFNPFFTTKPPGKGTGLGLDICYNIVVYRHKGEISFDSSPKGTVFTVKLPLNLKSRN